MDPCIANLPGVAFACCGHGVPGGKLNRHLDDDLLDHAYVSFEGSPKIVLRGNAARAAMEMLGGSPPAAHPDALPLPTHLQIEVHEGPNVDRWILGLAL